MAKTKERRMNDRIRNLRKISTETQPHIYMERAVLETEAYQMYEGKVSVPELRALVLKHFFTHKKLYIGEDELIVGEKGDYPQSAPTFPELCCHTLEDMHNMNDRSVVNFTVTEDDLKIQEEQIIPYWEDRSMRRRILDSMTEEWKEAYAAGIFTEFMEQRGPGHTVGSVKLYEKGYLDYQEDIKAALDAQVRREEEQRQAMAAAQKPAPRLVAVGPDDDVPPMPDDLEPLDPAQQDEFELDPDATRRYSDLQFGKDYEIQ